MPLTLEPETEARGPGSLRPVWPTQSFRQPGLYREAMSNKQTVFFFLLLNVLKILYTL